MNFCQLTTRKVAKVIEAKTPGHYGDGAGLYLQISKTGTSSWVFRFDLANKRHEMGLGSARIVTLKQARHLAREARENLLHGENPIAIRQARRDKVRADTARRITFREALDGCLAARNSEWRSDKHRRQWRVSVEQHALPVLGSLSVADIDVPHVLKVLEPIWHSTPETANRVRSRIERVLAWATARKYRRGDNPATWKGALEYLLPATRKIKGNVQHLAALPYEEMGAFLAEVRARRSMPARALEFLALTATRSGDVRGASWDEVSGNVWTIPGRRHKSGHDFRVPLSPRAVKILDELGEPKLGELIFPNERGDQLTDKILLNLAKELRPGITCHGLRSSFRDWCAARTNYPREVAEIALAHKTKGEVEKAYFRTDLLEKRRRLMADWARYCAEPAAAGDVVVSLHG